MWETRADGGSFQQGGCRKVNIGQRAEMPVCSQCKQFRVQDDGRLEQAE